MLKYVVELGYRKFLFTDQSDALTFARMAKLHAEEGMEVNIHIINDMEEDQAE